MWNLVRRDASGISDRRLVGAFALELVGLPLLTVCLAAARRHRAFADELLLYLAAVVVITRAGGFLPAVVAADGLGGDVRLTRTEWQLLEVLARHADRLVSGKQLLQDVWGPGYGIETNYLRVYMAQLRRKLEPDPARPRCLITEPGMGYRLVTVG
jgi:DNA-binding response OmpR family regulator